MTTAEKLSFSSTPLGESIGLTLEGFRLYAETPEHYQMHDLDLVRANPDWITVPSVRKMMSDREFLDWASQGASEHEKAYLQGLKGAVDQHGLLHEVAAETGLGIADHRLPELAEVRAQMAAYLAGEHSSVAAVQDLMELMRVEVPEFTSLRINPDTRIDVNDVDTRLAMIMRVVV